MTLEAGREEPATPFNNPAQTDDFLDKIPDANLVNQRLASALPHVRRSLPDRSHLRPIRYAPAYEWSKCAYCDDPAGDRYHYFQCERMSEDLLDTLVENGWWRTGNIIFKPCFPVVCCPGYSLRMPVMAFVPSKSHRRVIRKWNKFLWEGNVRWDNRNKNDGEKGTPTPSPPSNYVDQGTELATAEVEHWPNLVHTAITCSMVDEGEAEGKQPSPSKDDAEENVIGPLPDKTIPLGELESRDRQPWKRKGKPVTPGLGPDPNRPLPKKAKQVRLERRREKLRQRAATSGDPPTSLPPKSRQNTATPASLHNLLSDFRRAASDSGNNFRHRMDVKLLHCNPRSPELTSTLPQAYKLYDKFQEAVHPGKTRFFSVREFEWGFMNSPVCNYSSHLGGTYHMHYYLDGELVMLSIIDVLPTHFVSIYFIYDPDLRFMVPGIFSILVEIDLVQQLTGEQPAYFALGYYNHKSYKVNYKRQFKPQDVLCNETNVYVSLEDALPKLILKPYIRLAGDEVEEKEGRTAPLDNLIIRFDRQSPRPFRQLPYKVQEHYRKPLRQFISEAGSAVASQFVIEIVQPLF